MTLALTLWRAGGALAAPLLPLWLARRARRGKEFPARLGERRGITGLDRPRGTLLWLHAASVGESLSALPLIEALRRARPGLSVLVTSGTVTSARLLASRLGGTAAAPDTSGAMPASPWLTHQVAPLDVPAWASRFLDHWRPDAAVFVESEIWPAMLAALRARKVPSALVNARLSARSAARWAWARAAAREALDTFEVILAQTGADADRLSALTGWPVTSPGNLKNAAPPLPADAVELARLQALLGDRPAWVAASTHPGEEERVLAAHAIACADRPDLLLILAPRHPERGEAVAALAARDGHPAARRAPRRSLGQDPSGPVWVADTLGELGLWYRLARGAFLGGSLVPHGGQNPLEPARLGRPVAFGPHTANFAEVTTSLLAAGAATRVADEAALASWVEKLISNGNWAAKAGAAGAMVAGGGTAGRETAALDQTLAALLRLLPEEGCTAG
ncbi:3-deoxy-D-manno-octulosonic acid transferase [Elioraea sp.]|uniref:3-deoxy-D-manno-octulosonic acid transferase n=1 Tax=Elioraea sp. TaxID=2185103 RepID=UPI0025C1ED64|nr:3-deoxy-D-manno-octulosonic acid transferase [Elioraea sp.]